MKYNVIIKPLAKKDIDKAADIEKACFNAPWSYNQLAESLSMPDNLFLGAFSKDELVGYIGFYKVMDEGFVTNLAVKPYYRRKGIGRALLCRLIDECTSLKIRLITLEARESNRAALSLYMAEGFEVCGKRRGFYKNPVEDAVLLCRKISC